MLSKINKITTLRASIVIAIISIATFFTGLRNPFLGDDLSQIVNNTLVHSISNIRFFFEGSTFYSPPGTPLIGIFYRPIMTTVFSLLYTLFGPNTFYFHMFQLSLYILCAIMGFLVFRYFFKPVLALFLSLVFLVHPINSQVVFAIPSMQEELFFLFGITAIWLLLRLKSNKSLVVVALCLLLSLLSKETAIVFIAMALLYLFWFDRKRLYLFIGIMIIPITLYLVMKICAVGLFGYGDAPIDNLNLWGRLATVPAIILFYLYRFVFPLKLARVYYWVYPIPSLRHFWLPLIIDVAILGLVIYVARVLYKKLPKDQFLIFVFFTSWVLVGLLPHLQIIPLDATVTETWFYFPIFGLLGMIGVVLAVYLPKLKIQPYWFLMIAILIIGTFSFRTALRGRDYRDWYIAATTDITVSKEQYVAANNLAANYIDLGQNNEAKIYAARSVSVYPCYANYNNLGLALYRLGDYSGAMNAFKQTVKYDSDDNSPYEKVGELTLLTGGFDGNKQFLLGALNKFPRDASLWMYLAILEDKYNDNVGAKIAIQKATRYGKVNETLYNAIINNQPVTINIANTGKSVTIQ